ncbi:MAG: hypothetical protein Kow0090_00690 [Myxococcota bacterium]
MEFIFILLLALANIGCVDKPPSASEAPVLSTHQEEETDEDINRLAGSVFLIGFMGKSVDDEGVKSAKEALVSGRAVGVVFLGRNLPERGEADYAEKVKALTDFFKEGVTPAPIIAVDQEGGVVERLRPGRERLPAFSELGAIEDIKEAQSRAFNAGREAARQLASLGFNLNFSPVIDIYREQWGGGEREKSADGKEMVLRLEKRSFGEKPHRVALLGAEIIWGHLTEGVAPCAKHFPGHGVTLSDTHYELPEIDIPINYLMEYELVPFIAAIGNGVPAIMSSHIINRSLDAELPATLSKAVLTGFLRYRLGFRGVIISDDMTMDAIRNLEGGNSRAAVQAIKAGADLLIFAWRPEDWTAAYDAVRFGIASGEINRSQLIISRRRVFSLLQNPR